MAFGHTTISKTKLFPLHHMPSQFGHWLEKINKIIIMNCELQGR